MSNDEARKHKGLALLEFEEAKAEHQSVLDEIRTVRSNLGKVEAFFANLGLGNSYGDSQASRFREEIKSAGLGDFVAQAIILDGKLTGAKKRLQEAIAVKKTFGLE